MTLDNNENLQLLDNNARDLERAVEWLLQGHAILLGGSNARLPGIMVRCGESPGNEHGVLGHDLVMRVISQEGVDVACLKFPDNAPGRYLVHETADVREWHVSATRMQQYRASQASTDTDDEDE